MRPSNKSRSRNKSGGHSSQRRVGNIINRVFDSAGPDGKVRGTPQQIIDKYQVLARDAQVSGDRVAAESYLQHAEHYSRLLGEAQRQQQESRQQQERGEDGGQRGEDGGQRGEQQSFDNGRQRGASSSPEGSGLTTIDIGDGDDSSGPVETPENRRSETVETHSPERAASEGKPVQQAGSGNGADPSAPAEEPVKRPRTRRRAKAESNGEAAPAE